MKIAYFLGALNRGGAETLILDICRRHESVPYDFVCIYRHEGNISEEFKSSGAPMMQIPKTGGMLRYLLDIRKTLKREHVTIVHSQTGANSAILALALMGTGIKIVTTFHGHLFADAARWQRKIVYRASEKILCVSEYQKRYYEEKWKLPKENKLQVVYNGIDFGKIDAAIKSQERRAENVMKLAMVGNFIKGRSQIIVAKALKRVKSVDFYFIGRKDDKEPKRYDDCVKYCEDNRLKNVHFLGGRNDVPSILKSIDGFVYSTEHDTFGIAVIEAIAAGLPVVVNDWPVMIEVCGEENAGIRYFNTEDVDDAAVKIEELITNIEDSKHDAKANAKIVREKYSIEHHIKQLDTIYKKI